MRASVPHVAAGAVVIRIALGACVCVRVCACVCACAYVCAWFVVRADRVTITLPIGCNIGITIAIRRLRVLSL